MNFWSDFKRRNGIPVTIGALLSGAVRRAHNAMLRQVLPGRPLVTIHPSAYMRGLSSLRIGEGFRAGRGLWLEAVTLDGDRTYEPIITIGRNVIINENVHIGATHRIEIGDDVLMGSRIFISDHNHGTYEGVASSDPDIAPRLRELATDRPVRIGDRVWIGDMVSILPGVNIGSGSVIGGNSVVTRNIPDNSIAVGNPARVIKRFDRTSGQWRRVDRT